MAFYRLSWWNSCPRNHTVLTDVIDNHEGIHTSTKMIILRRIKGTSKVREIRTTPKNDFRDWQTTDNPIHKEFYHLLLFPLHKTIRRCRAKNVLTIILRLWKTAKEQTQKNAGVQRDYPRPQRLDGMHTSRRRGRIQWDPVRYQKSARELRRHAGPLRDARDILQLRNATGVR